MKYYQISIIHKFYEHESIDQNLFTKGLHLFGNEPIGTALL